MAQSIKIRQYRISVQITPYSRQLDWLAHSALQQGLICCCFIRKVEDLFMAIGGHRYTYERLTWMNEYSRQVSWLLVAHVLHIPFGFYRTLSMHSCGGRMASMKQAWPDDESHEMGSYPSPTSYLRFRLFEPHVPHGIFTREGGVSAPPFASLNVSYSVGDVPATVTENRRRCAATLGLTIEGLTTAGLVHGAAVSVVDGPASTLLHDGSGLVEDVDALITATPGRGLLITAADCLQILLLDPRRPAIGLVHAGWRGLVAGVIGGAVTAMVERLGCRQADLRAGIGPGLGPCCARFSDPARELPPSFAPYLHGHYVDLWSAARDQLRAAGLLARHIEHHALCTVCRRDTFFSHRGDQGRTGRFAAIIVLPG